jgi:hypothetical protein
MIRRADIIDDTYEPYHESVEVMYEEEIHGVNLLEVTASTQTIDGVTFTVNEDETITINGSTATRVIFRVTEPFLLPIGTYLFSGVPNGANPGTNTGHNMYIEEVHIDGSAISYHSLYSGEKEIQVTANTKYMRGYINAWPNSSASNLVMKPMLRKADIEDSTYRPYNPQAIQNQLNAQGVLGAKNLMPITLSNVTESGVTFTKNDDNTITLNGTATATLSGRKISELTPSTLPKGNYILSRKNISQGSDVHFALTKLSASGTYIGNLREANTTDNVLVTVDYNGYDKIGVIIWIRSGTVLNNYTIYPMLRLASDPDDTYQPYAMTNRELTEKKINLSDLKTVVSSSSDFAAFKTAIANL